MDVPKVIVFPSHYSVVEKHPSKGWGFWPTKRFFPALQLEQLLSPANQFKSKCLEFGLDWNQVLSEVRQCGGKPGFYLVNLRDREYYFCGSDLKDVKTFVQQQGIGV